MHKTKRLLQLGASSIILTTMLLMAPLTVSAQATSDPGNGSHLPNFKHVFVIMMENTGYASLIGNPHAPFINFAAKVFGLATNYYGVTHPSQPNYIAATSGSTQGVTSDNDTTVNATNIVDQLESHDKTWKAYMQSLSLCNGDLLASSCGNQLYERKHDPFVSYQDVQSNPARMANIVDLSKLGTDLRNNTVPNYAWISPDQCHDMHGRSAPATDPCSFSNEQELISAGDTFLKRTVSEILLSRAWTGNSVIFIAWDESDFTGTGPAGFGDTSGCCDAVPGGGHVVGLTIARRGPFLRTSAVAYNHYSMLATIEDSWHLGCLNFTCDTANVKPMRDLVSPRFL